MHALLLVIAIVLIAYAVMQLRKGQRIQATVSVVIGAGFLLWFLTTDAVPPEFTGMAPYVTTLFVLAFLSQTLRMPAADGQIYRKGSAG